MSARTTSRARDTDGEHGQSDLALAVALAVGAALVTASLVFLVHTKSAQIEVGYRIHDLRQELVTLRQQRATLEVERAALARPGRLSHLAQTELGLVPPVVDRVVPAPTEAPR